MAKNKNSFYFNYYIIIFVLLISIVIYLYTLPRYISFLPTLPIYPDSNHEAIVVKNITENRDPDLIRLFYKTDDSVADAFTDVLQVDKATIESVMYHVNYLTLFFKYTINRPRPVQIDKTIDVLFSRTGNTPAYPSGHSCQAFYIAKYYSRIYPEKKAVLYTIAEQCGQARIQAGIHYPSDHRFSKWLVETLF